jgi:23S rRNA pseudoU1915 N3-methylase RlmH
VEIGKKFNNDTGLEKIEEVNEDISQSYVNTFNSAANGELKEIVDIDRATEVQNEISIRKEKPSINVTDNKDEFKKINMRGKLWKIICNVEKIKMEVLEKFNSNPNKEKLNIKSSVMVNQENHKSN